MASTIRSDETLIHIAAGDFIKHIDENETLAPYMLVQAIASRARELTDEKAHEVQNGAKPSEVYKNFHAVAEASDEIYTGKIKIKT